MRVVVTGSSGRVGTAAVAELVKSHRVVGFDIRPPAGAIAPHEFIAGHLTDTDAVHRAIQGADCVVHLAAAPDDDPGPDAAGAFPAAADNFLSQLVPANVVGPYHVLKACVRAGVRRVILASSGQVVDGLLGDESSYVDTASPHAPRYLYACTKVFLESLGRVFAKQHGLAVLAVRLGWCPRPGQEAAIRAEPLSPWVYLSGGDAGRFFAALVGSDEWPTTTDPDGKSFRYGIVYATSRSPNGREMYDLSAARALGYEPADDWAGWLAANPATRTAQGVGFAPTASGD